MKNDELHALSVEVIYSPSFIMKKVTLLTISNPSFTINVTSPPPSNKSNIDDLNQTVHYELVPKHISYFFTTSIGMLEY